MKLSPICCLLNWCSGLFKFWVNLDQSFLFLICFSLRGQESSRLNLGLQMRIVSFLFEELWAWTCHSILVLGNSVVNKELGFNEVFKEFLTVPNNFTHLGNIYSFPITSESLLMYLNATYWSAWIALDLIFTQKAFHKMKIDASFLITDSFYRFYRSLAFQASKSMRLSRCT